MANRSASTRRPLPGRSNAGLIAIGAVVAAVLVVGAIVVVVVGGGDDDDVDVDDAAVVTTTPNGVAICGPVADDTATTPAPAESEVALAAFPDDDIFKPDAVAGAALPAFSQEIQRGAPDIALCEPAPVVSGYDYAGDEITIDPATDGPTMVVLLAHWCPHCNREIPVLNTWRDSGDVPDNLDIVGVSTGVDPDGANFPPDEWLPALDWQWPVLADSDLGADDPDDDVVASVFRAYGGTTFPTMLLFGSDGRLLARYSGKSTAAVIAARVNDAIVQDAAASA